MERPSLEQAEVFESLRPLLFSIAYRMLGSASEAEDAVQDAYLRFYDVAIAGLDSPKAYLTTIVTRLCLDRLKSARIAREVYTGPWLPEPALTADLEPTEFSAVERDDEISLALLLLLERLSPDERAVYVLREAFDFPYAEIAPILHKTTAAARQLAHRARERIADDRPRYSISVAEQQSLTESFLTATRQGDIGQLTALLAQNVAIWTDGGGKVQAASRPIFGQVAASRFLQLLLDRVAENARWTIAGINGATGLLYWIGDQLAAVTILEGAAGAIEAMYVIVNPDKLAFLQKRLQHTARE
jgi:RNA polymerase sigma-70 factor (ECF subfamily)